MDARQQTAPTSEISGSYTSALRKRVGEYFPSAPASVVSKFVKSVQRLNASKAPNSEITESPATDMKQLKAEIRKIAGRCTIPEKSFRHYYISIADYERLLELSAI
jgi:hypothetical protein